MQHFCAGGGDQLGQALAAVLDRVNHALPAALPELGKGVFEAGTDGDDAIFERGGVFVAFPVQGRDDVFTKAGGFFQHGLGGFDAVVLKTRQGGDFLNAGQFFQDEQDVFDGSFVAHTMLLMQCGDTRCPGFLGGKEEGEGNAQASRPLKAG